MDRADGSKGAIPLPGTMTPEPRFREQVREALGLTWDVSDEAIFAEVKRLKVVGTAQHPRRIA